MIFFVLFIGAYYLLNYIFREILHLAFSDLVKQFHNYDWSEISNLQFHKFEWWQFYKPFILLITLSLTCAYTAIFKRNYFKETFIAFSIFIVVFFAFGALSKLYTDKQQKDNQVIYQNLIVGKWHHTNRRIGNVVVVFNKDSTGYRFTNTAKTEQQFRYFIGKGSFIIFFFESNKFEFYEIEGLTTKTLDISAGFHTKTKGNVYSASFERSSP